jgi:hypothetical protein
MSGLLAGKERGVLVELGKVTKDDIDRIAVDDMPSEWRLACPMIVRDEDTLGAAEEAVAEASRIQSHVTHHSRLADAGTLTVIRMVQAALLGRPKSDLRLLADALVALEPV